MSKYLNPKSDRTFKKVFGEHKELLISFLNALLPLQPGCEIVSLEYLPPELVPVNPDKKDTIVDVRCTENGGRQFLVEMQMYWTDEFKRRTLFNTCKAYVKPAEKGMDYRDLQPIYTLALVNDVAFPEFPDEFYHEFVPTHRNHPDEIMDDMYMVFVELPKFKASTWHDRKMAVLWLRFLTEIDEHTKEIPSELAADELVAKALSLVEESAYTDAELLAIDKYWDQVSRERTALNAAERKGRAEGEAIGIAKGEAIGIAKGEAIGIAKGEAIGISKGEAIGRTKEKMENARRLKANGVPAEIIASSLSISIDDVEAL